VYCVGGIAVTSSLNDILPGSATNGTGALHVPLADDLIEEISRRLGNVIANEREDRPPPPGRPQPMSTPADRSFYVTGGTLRPDAPSYVERQADRDLCDDLACGEFCGATARAERAMFRLHSMMNISSSIACPIGTACGMTQTPEIR
jgi:hypothetical protein